MSTPNSGDSVTVEDWAWPDVLEALFDLHVVIGKVLHLGWLLRGADGWLVEVSTAVRDNPSADRTSWSLHTGWMTSRWFYAPTYEAAVTAAVAWIESKPAQVYRAPQNARREGPVPDQRLTAPWCSCTWGPLFKEGGVRGMTHRDSTCLQHGNGSAWWRVQDKAKALASELPGLIDRGESDGRPSDG